MTKNVSRISKLLIDRNGEDPGSVLMRRRKFTVTLRLGDDVGGSRSLQLAALTAARLANWCFPGAVHVDAPASVLDARALVGAPKSTSLGIALARELGKRGMTPTEGGRVLLFGNAAHNGAALRVTFDGWVAVTGPQHTLSRYAEREHCSLAPILAAALAISETFLGFAGIDVTAGRRVVGLSLWRPDLGHADPDAVGSVVTALPKQAWLLGLGHLGNAYLWALATLPFAKPADVLLYLLDFDRVEKANTETGVLFRSRDIGRFKTRVCSDWLEQFKINTCLVERRFDDRLRRLDGEPALALSGFDNNEARQLLVDANFGRVVDSGLGGTATNFDSISLRTWPNARAADAIWPVLSANEKEEAEKRAWKAAEENPGYRRLKRDRCGLIEYAGKSVAVPFAGIAAATLVVADTLRVLNDGGRVENLKVRLGSPSGELAVTWSTYSKEDLAAVAYTPAVKY
ncbi:hypothetical protein R1521_14780 [Rhizobium brockwellii]|uniref:THIF-type NAD/FAD binding fold domain-containing protein n=1 Tax=Rhizobium brockwellii TaxID=3019932 RepID=A0ABU3YLG2_9HYPH|nr:ThiF family adenylyltransferase [Rhizobium brockwellii]MDV4179771.1 hypothetical protein [Rhizobium brockwellii]MDV4186693.1 hypothetical protein [Rhizobium brockwellii]